MLQHSLIILGLSSIFPFFLSYYHSLAFWSPFALQQLNSFLAFLSSHGDLLCRVSHFHCLSVALLSPKKTSLHRRCNLTPASNVCEAVLMSLFWTSNDLNELPEMHFEFPFHPIDNLTMAFLTDQS